MSTIQLHPRLVALKRLLESGQYLLARNLALDLASDRPNHFTQSILELITNGRHLAAHSKIHTSLWLLLCEDFSFNEMAAGEKWFVNGIECAWCPPGSFFMGSPQDEEGRKSDEARHLVTLTNGFWISDHPVTRAEYFSTKDYRYSKIDNPDYPVTDITWHDAVRYCCTLTNQQHESDSLPLNMFWRLPTEAEWEYAARAGTEAAVYQTPLDDIAWHEGNMDGSIKPVKMKVPNSWKIYDMIGNVWEWCSDWYGPYESNFITDPKGPENGDLKVTRGVSWEDWSNLNYEPGYRAAARDGSEPNYKGEMTGFRPVLTYCQTQLNN
jgi:formylglycine-generating enzyme required for sulfatase activity